MACLVARFFYMVIHHDLRALRYVGPTSGALSASTVSSQLGQLVTILGYMWPLSPLPIRPAFRSVS